MSLRLEPAPLDQIPALHAILVLCGEHMYRTLGLKHWYPYMALDRFVEFSAGKDFFAVYDDAALVGTYNVGSKPRHYYDMNIWRDPSAPALYLGGLGVLPARQGHGIGKWCMAQVDALAHERKCAAVRFDAVDNHTGLLAFYENLRYTNLGKIPTSWGAVMCFEKILAGE